jgi:hypothetical protein
VMLATVLLHAYGWLHVRISPADPLAKASLVQAFNATFSGARCSPPVTSAGRVRHTLGFDGLRRSTLGYSGECWFPVPLPPPKPCGRRSKLSGERWERG